MKQVLSDLWETRTDSPFPGLTTHAYLWSPANILFYSPAGDAEFDALAELGGVNDQYLSHRDEAGPMLARITERFGSTLHAPAADVADIGKHAHVDVPLNGRYVDYNGVEIIPTPGHSPGSVCYLVTGADGRYLFTGDTLFRNPEGQWWAGYIEGFHQPGDADTIAESLRTLAEVSPDFVISSAFQGDSAVHRVEPGQWRGHIAHAIAGLPTSART
ncbi:MBL fold metallo-hydrolase [Mycolicibacterium sp. D5.8-2]|uniref:MBL fold metallo-hydrolase n=1 Tax=Mycolicibacterium sp. D5.8-2 TaxID=3085903 RepID=UPI00298C3528|nr:MBL fold metallo-hydrolase [Mycolicibacterium sp. D5.8-2]MDW5609690.1 MBL fold metallo-hydrolase [Mycolicibacterium sp. D5.8-2]